MADWAWVIVGTLFLAKNEEIGALDLPVFLCRDMPLLCDSEGSYACSERKRTTKCNGTTIIDQETPVDLSTCRFKCHFSESCGSYAWSPESARCTQCGATEEQMVDVQSWLAPLEERPGEARLMDWGIHHGRVLQFVVAGIEYISKGYISVEVAKFTTKTTLISGTVDKVEFKIQGPFCVRVPSAREWSRDKKKPRKRFNPEWVIWLIVSPVVIMFASRVEGIRRKLRFWKHRMRIRCM